MRVNTCGTISLTHGILLKETSGCDELNICDGSSDHQFSVLPFYGYALLSCAVPHLYGIHRHGVFVPISSQDIDTSFQRPALHNI